MTLPPAATDILTHLHSLPPSRLPVKEGLVDWDSAESLSIPDMARSLAYIRANGELPVSLSNSSPRTRRTDHGRRMPLRGHGLSSSLANPSQSDLDSKEDKNTVGQCPVPDATIEATKAQVQAWLQPGQPGARVLQSGLRVCLLDGFLLYTPPMETVMSQLDLKLFLLVSRAKATQRREARDGYVTLEGFWTDPPGYVDKIVWPNYAESHAWLFENGDVEASLKEEVLAAQGIQAQVGKGLDVDFTTTLQWAVETVMKDLVEFVDRSS